MKNLKRIAVTAILLWATVMNAQSGTLAGVIRIAGESGLDRGARVRLLHLGEPVADTFVRADGGFRFDNVPMGRYDVAVEIFGVDSVSVPVTFMGSLPDMLIEVRRRAPKKDTSGGVVNFKEESKPKATAEMTLAFKEQSRGNLKAMLKHLTKALNLGSPDAKKFLESLGK